MKQIFKSKQGSISGIFKATALAALLVSTLVATTAEAAVLITFVRRIVSAEVGLDPEFERIESRDLSGAFNKTLSNEQFLDGQGLFSSTATQNSDVGAQIFSGTGNSALVSPVGSIFDADSIFTIRFTLTDSYVLSGFARLEDEQTSTVPGERVAESRAELVGVVENGPDQRIFDSRTDDTSSLFGTLTAGDYELDVGTRINASFDAASTGRGSFDFLFALTEVIDTPPNSVPEPGSLALAMAGLAAIAAARKKKTAGEGDLETRSQGRKDARPVADSSRQTPRMSDIDSRDVFVD
jgi:PEP-CTERM motif